MRPFPLPGPVFDTPILLATFDPALAALLGPAHLFDPHCDGLGPSEFWAFTFDCGLSVIVGKSPLQARCGVVADEPEVAHVARHLRLGADSYEACLQRSPGRDDVARAAELLHHRLWRRDDNGNDVDVDVTGLTSLRDAACLQRALEAGQHRQRSWIEDVRSGAIAPSASRPEEPG